MTESVQKESDGSLRVYEAGYLLLPSIPEEKVGDEVSLIRSTIEKHGGVFMSEVAARYIPLAYEVVKHIGTRNERFDSAYFGAIHFKIESSAVVELTKELDANKNIIRFLLIKAEKESRKSIAKREAKDARASEEEDEATEDVASFTQEDIDKSIDELVEE